MRRQPYGEIRTTRAETARGHRNRRLDERRADVPRPSAATLIKPPVNVLLGQRAHDPDLEAPLLQRLLEAGASVNQQSRRGEPPFIQLLQAPKLTDRAMVGLYGVILARPDLDLDARAMPASKTNLETIRERIVAPGGYVRRNLRAMLEARDTA